MNSIVRVGDGDGFYGEQWNLSGDRRVSIVLGDWNPRPQAVLFYRLIPSIFHQTLSKYTPKNSFKMHFFYMSRANIFRYFYFFTKYIALLSLIVNKNEVFIYNMKNISLSFYSILYDILNVYTCKKTERWMNFEIVQLPN
jgi:hypothetical protein